MEDVSKIPIQHSTDINDSKNTDSNAISDNKPVVKKRIKSIKFKKISPKILKGKKVKSDRVKQLKKEQRESLPPELFVNNTSQTCACFDNHEHIKIQEVIYEEELIGREILESFSNQSFHESSLTSPIITKVESTNIYENYAEFDYQGDISQVAWFYVGISFEPGGFDLAYTILYNFERSTHRVSFKKLELSPNDFDRSIYFSIWAVDYNGQLSEPGISNAIIMNTSATLGQQHYAMNIKLSPMAIGLNGFPQSEPAVFPANMQTFLNRVVPIIKEVYGPPSKSSTVTFVQDARYDRSNIYLAGRHAILGSFDVLNPRLLVHELIHAWKGKVTLTSDKTWDYDPKLSGFEESLAEGVAYIVMNKYHEQYPDNLLDGIYTYDSLTGPEYEWRNLSILTTEDFWSDRAGMNLHLERYHQGAAAIIKMWVEDENVFKNFNKAYYKHLNENIGVVPTRNLTLALFVKVLDTVEEIPIKKWLKAQRIFDCKNRIGPKIFIKRYNYCNTNEYLSFNQIFYFETFKNGSDWSILKEEYQDVTDFSQISASTLYDYHNKNGKIGTVRLLNYKGEEVWRNSNIQLLPVGNPPQVLKFASAHLDFTSIDIADSHLSNDYFNEPNRHKVKIVESGRYILEINFEGVVRRFYGVLGHDFANFRGVYGFINGLTKGTIKMVHSFEPSNVYIIPVEKCVFKIPTNFTSRPNPNTTDDKLDSIPGKITIRLFNSKNQDLGKVKRNIGYGDYYGNQVFFLKRRDFKK